MINKELVPLRRGVWIRSDDGTHFCSECGHDAGWKIVKYNGIQVSITEDQSGYCPHCGSFMEVEGEKKREKDL